MIDKFRLDSFQASEQYRRDSTRPQKSENSFGDMLRERATTVGTETDSRLALSRHALSRVEARGIEMDAARMERLSRSIDLAEQKGIRNMLVLENNNAFIVDVSQGRVVTAISQEELRENVFTNIDGAVLL